MLSWTACRRRNNMAKLPEHPRCPHCGSTNTERHWGDELMQAGANFIVGFADGYLLNGALRQLNDDALSKGADATIDMFSQKYTCNHCNKNFTLSESEYKEEVNKLVDNDDEQDLDDDDEDYDDEDYDDEEDLDDEVERESFDMEIMTCSREPGSGVIIRGTIGTGRVCTGEIINISGATGPEYQVGVVEIRYNSIIVEHAVEDDECEILIIGIDKSKIKPKMVASYKPLSNKSQVGSTLNNLVNRGKFMKALIKRRSILSCQFSKIPENKVVTLASKYGIDAIEALSIACNDEAVAKIKAQQETKAQDNLENENVYLDEYKQCLADGEITASEIRLLNKLAKSLGICDERARELEASLMQPNLVLTAEEEDYLTEYKEALTDGELSATSIRLLNKIRTSLGISEERAREIENSLK